MGRLSGRPDASVEMAVSCLTQRLLAQRGFSLPELMIACALGVIVFMAAVELYATVRELERIERTQARMLDQARLARHLITEALTAAGHPGCHPQRQRNLSPATASAVKPAILPSEALVIRHFTPGAQPLVVAPGDTGARVLLDRPHGIAPGQLAVVAAKDAAGACLRFRQASTDRMILDRGAGSAAVNQKPSAGYQPLSGRLQVYQPEVTQFFTAESVGIEGVQSLYRRRDSAGARREEMVVGIEQLAMRYGVSTDGDARVDAFKPAHAVDNPAQIRAVEVSFLVTDTRGAEPRLRHPVTLVVALRNRP